MSKAKHSRNLKEVTAEVNTDILIKQSQRQLENIIGVHCHIENENENSQGFSECQTDVGVIIQGRQYRNVKSWTYIHCCIF